MFWIAKDRPRRGQQQYYWIFKATVPAMRDANVIAQCRSFKKAKETIVRMLKADIRAGNGDAENLRWQISHFKAQPITDVIPYITD